MKTPVSSLFVNKHLKALMVACCLCLSILGVMAGCSPADGPTLDDKSTHSHATEPPHNFGHEENVSPSSSVAPKIKVNTVEANEAEISAKQKELIDSVLGEESSSGLVHSEAEIGAQHKSDLGHWILVRNYSGLSEKEQSQPIYKLGRDATLKDQQRHVSRVDAGSLSLFATTEELVDRMGAYLTYLEEFAPNASLGAIERCFVLLIGEGETGDATE